MLSGLVQTGETPLHNAAARGHLEVAKLLLEAGTSPTIRDIVSTTSISMHTQTVQYVNISTPQNDQSAIDVANNNHHDQMAELIQHYIKDKSSGSA